MSAVFCKTLYMQIYKTPDILNNSAGNTKLGGTVNLLEGRKTVEGAG